MKKDYKVEDYVKQYEDKIRSKEIIVGKKILSLYDKWHYDLKNFEAYYDAEEGYKWIYLMEKYFYTGPNQRIKLTLVQKAQIQMFFGTLQKILTNGEYKVHRYYNEIFLLVGRGYGKSTIAGIIQAASIILNNSYRKEYLNVAYVKEQGAIVINSLAKIIRNSPIFIENGYEIQGSAEKTRIVNKEIPDFSAQVKTLKSESLQGLDFSSMVLDEIHTWPDKSVITDIRGGKKNNDAFTYIISTNGSVRGGALDYMLDLANYALDKKNFALNGTNRLLPWIYEIDDYKNWNTPEEAAKANPNWYEPMFQTRKNEILNGLEQGKKLGYDAQFKTTYLNMSITSSNALLSYEDLNYENEFDIDEIVKKYGDYEWFGGIDLGLKHDFTAASLVCYVPEEEKLYIITKSWTSQKSFEYHHQRSKFAIDVHKELGELEIDGREVLNNLKVIDWFEKWSCKVNIALIGYDPAHFSKTAEHFDAELGWGTYNFLTKIIQTPGTLHEHMVHLQELVKLRNCFFNSKLLHWELGNVEIVEVKQGGSIKWLPDNTNKDLLHDGASSLLTALAARYQYNKKYYNIQQ